MAQIGPTKAELQEIIDQVSEMVSDALDPALTREEVVQKLQEIDSFLNEDDDSEDEDEEEDDTD